MRAQTHRLPVAALLLAASLWGLWWYPFRLLAEAGLPGVWASAVCYGSALLAGVFFSRTLAGSLTRYPRRMVLLAITAGWCNIGYILAILEGSVARALMLFYLAPLWTALIGRWWLGERITRSNATALGLGLMGALIMLGSPGSGSYIAFTRADGYALSSGLAFAVSNAAVRALPTVPVIDKTLAAWIGVLVVACIAIGLVHLPLPNTTGIAWTGAVVLGLAGVSITSLAVQYGVTHLPLARSAVILLFEILVGALSAHWIAGEQLHVHEWIGGILIIGAAYLSARSTETHTRERY